MRKIAVMALLVVSSVTRAGPYIATLDKASGTIAGNNTVLPPYAFLTIADSTTDNTIAANQVRMRVEIANGNPAEFGTIGWNLNGVTDVDFMLFGAPTGTGSGNASLWTLKTQSGGVPMNPFGKFSMTLAPNNSNNTLSGIEFYTLFSDPDKARISSFVGLNADAFAFGLDYRPASGGGRGNVAAVPEASSLLLMGVAATGLAFVGWRKRRRLSL